MKKVDPDVAALLDDLPPTKLPPVLVGEGWGRQSMRQISGHRKSPSDVQQPTYDHHCVQCGYPITRGRHNEWTDHAGRTECDRVLGGDLPDHITAEDAEAYKIELQRYHARLQHQLYVPLQAPTFCRAAKISVIHDHVCMEKGDHFGFHQCVTCHHLWR